MGGAATQVVLTVRFPAAPSAARQARTALNRWLASGNRPIDPRVRADLLVVVSELVTNAVQAGAYEVELQALRHDFTVEMRVSDDGQGFAAEIDTHLPGTDTARGRGLPIAAAYTDEIDVTRAAGRTVVRVVRRVG